MTVRDETAIMEIRKMLSLFLQTLAMYEYNTSVIGKLYTNLRDQWSLVSAERASQQIQSIYLEGVYQQFTVQSKADYMSSVLHLKIVPTMPSKYPHTFVFSEMLVKTCRVVFDLINVNIDILEKGESSISILKLVDTLMSDGVNSVLISTARQTNKSISQLVQVKLDADTFLSFCDVVEKYVDDKAQLHGQGISKLRCRSLFKETSDEALRAIRQVAVVEADEFFGANPDWLRDREATEPLDNIADAMMFATSAFMCLEYVSSSVAAEIRGLFLGQLSDRLKRSVYASKKINENGLELLDLTVREIEAHAAGLGDIPALIELRQLLDLFLGGNIEGILNPQIQQSVYGRLEVVQVKALVERLKDWSGGRGVDPRNTAFAKKNLETILKKMKWSR